MGLKKKTKRITTNDRAKTSITERKKDNGSEVLAINEYVLKYNSF